MTIVVMGVAGSGKTTVGRRLADALGWPFYDGDDFHPLANVEKMARGDALTDADRAPWLDALASLIAGADGTSAVLACSALKGAYRKRLATGTDAVFFVYLRASVEVIRERLAARRGHFFDPDLLESQFAALEEPAEALTLDATRPPEALVAAIRAAFEV